MDKAQFLKILDNSLANLPKAERAEILQDYEEYFSMGALDGKTERETANALGNPQVIGKELVASYELEQTDTRAASSTNFLKTVWIIIGLAFFNLVFVLGPFLFLGSLLLAAWIVGVSFIATPVLVLVNVMIYPEVFQLFDLFNAIALCGLGILTIIVSYLITKKFIQGLLRYVKFNARLVNGGSNYA